MVFHVQLDGFPGRIVHYAVIDGNTSPIDLTQFTTKEGTHFVAIDADYVCQQEHLLIACMKTINREETGKKLITGNINREVIYSLSPTKNAKEALQLFGASKESHHILLVSMEKEDPISSFITENQIQEEPTNRVLYTEKSEAIQNRLISHFGLSQGELAIYPFNDLIQMGVSMKNKQRELQKQQEITLLQLKQAIKREIDSLKNEEVQLIEEIATLEKEYSSLVTKTVESTNCETEGPF